MMSRIGNKPGFTLIEVMVAVAILSLGTVLLFHSFFTCADASRHAFNLLNARLWIDGKIGEEKEFFLSSKVITQPQESGDFTFNSRLYVWQKSIQPIDTGLYSMTLSLSWKEAGRQRSLSSATYLAAP